MYLYPDGAFEIVHRTRRIISVELLKCLVHMEGPEIPLGEGEVGAPRVPDPSVSLLPFLLSSRRGGVTHGDGGGQNVKAKR